MRQKVKLYIGDKLADLNDSSFVLFSYTLEDLTNPTIVRNSWSRTINLPGTPTNNGIFGHIARSDRETQYASGQYTGVYFDANVRTPFQLFSDTGELLEKGYLKLDNITRNGNRVDYSVTLYGGLGGFFYSLSHDSDGNPLTLADLKYTGSSAASTELDFTITASNVRAAWNRLAGSGSNTLWDILNFAPAYNGLPGGVFDADKALMYTGNSPLPVPEGESNVNGFALVSLTRKYTEWEVGDLRSYLQRPVIRLRKIIEAICQSYNNGGYTVQLDSAFFSDSNPRYDKAWITLPLLDEITLNIEDTDNPVQTGTSSDVYYDLSISGGGVATTLYSVNIDITPQISASSGLNTSAFWYLYATETVPTGTAYYQTYITYNVQLLDASSNILAQKTIHCSSQPSLDSTVPQIDYVGYFSPQSSTFAKFGSIVPHITISAYGAKYIHITRLVTCKKFGEPGTVGVVPAAQRVFNQNGQDIDTYVQVTHSYAYSNAVRLTTSSAARSGMTITKGDLLSNTKTPADYLLSYCKMFGLVFTFDKTTNTVSIKKRQNFYDSSSTIDLAHRVNMGKPMTIRPFAYDNRWYEWSLEPIPSEFMEYYQNVYGRRYGAQRVNTGFSFNADTKRLLDGNAFKDACEVLAQGRYFEDIKAGTVYWPAVFTDPGATYYLLGSTGDLVEHDVPTVPTGALVNYWNTGKPTYDYMSRPQFCGAEGKAIATRDVLLFYDGHVQRTDIHGISLTDDVAAMTRLNNNTPCWLLTYGQQTGTQVQSLPHFSRMMLTSNQVQFSWDFGVPAELAVPFGYYTPYATIYGGFWVDYINDRYDDDSKVLTCHVDLRGLPVGPELLGRFFYWDGAVWALNKITDYSLTTYDDTQCEFVKVQDIDAYTT